jgi:hypothetical protein
MSTSFSTKVSILAEVPNVLFSKNVELLPAAMTYVEETWEMLCVALKVDPNAKYENSDDIVEKSSLWK